jgi:hypothetical protein
MSDEEKENLKKQILDEANLIIESVNWVEKQISMKLTQLDNARTNFLIKEEELIERDIRNLLASVRREDKEIDNFLIRYSGVIKDAKDGNF